MRAVRTTVGCFFVLACFANAQTNFCVQSIQRNPDDTITLTWPALSGKTYHVMSADALDGLWQDIPNGQLTAGTNDLTLCYTDPLAPVTSQRFYKVRRDRPQLVMTLVLDRSGSMDPFRGGGGAFLAPAVTDFINHFDDNTDWAAMVSFGSSAKVEVPMGHLFRNAITTAVSNFVYSGGTFAHGGLTNALVQNNSVVTVPGESVIKMAVFITDGMANMIQVKLNCPPQTVWNIGGYDVGGFVGFFDPITGDEACAPVSGGSPSCCPGANGFISTIDGTLKSFFSSNVAAEAVFRTIQVANDMRGDGMYVYSIGLGSGINMTFLQQVANDPISPTFNPAQPIGFAPVAPTPADLQTILELIASQLLAR